MLIGINGFKGAGKDTVGQILVDEWGFTRKSFAAKLKESVAALFDITIEDVDRYKDLNADVVLLGKPMSFRVFLQRYGTEAHRNVFGDKFWINHVLDATPWWAKHNKWVITDARFENELSAIHAAGGYNIQVRRPDTDREDGHASEVRPAHHLIDCIITNDGSLADLAWHVNKALELVTEANNGELI